jgi:hypothetical protein
VLKLDVHQWPQRPRKSVQGNFVATVADRVDGHVAVRVVVRESNVDERGMVPQGQQAKTQPVENVHKARVSGPVIFF